MLTEISLIYVKPIGYASCFINDKTTCITNKYILVVQITNKNYNTCGVVGNELYQLSVAYTVSSMASIDWMTIHNQTVYTLLDDISFICELVPP